MKGHFLNKSITKETLTLKDDGPVRIILQNMSRVRTWAQCEKVYTIGNLKGVIEVGEPSKDTVDKRFKDFLEKGGWARDPRTINAKKVNNVVQANQKAD